MKRSLSLLLVLATLWLHGTMAVNASVLSTTRRATDGEAAALLAAALISCRAEVDLSALAIPTNAISEILTRVLHEDPALFHVAPTLSYAYDGAGMVLTVYPTYTLEGEALATARTLYRRTVDRLCRGADPAWSEADRVLYLHDLLAGVYAYDYRYGENNYDAYTFFRDGYGVCQAYALAFCALARALGLAADFVYSDAMDHAWNHVRVDGEWYHVDVTRDDPADGPSDTVLHHRLLRSDEGMATLGYRDYTCAGSHTCHSGRFETPEGLGWLSNVPNTVGRRVGDRWVFPATEGLSYVVALSPTPTAYPPGDVDTDGAVTPVDLLCLRRWHGQAVDGGLPTQAPLPEAAMDAFRQYILTEALRCIMQ